MSMEIRVPLVEPDTRPELAALEAEIRAQRGGDIAVLYQALLNSPAIASGWERMLTAVRNQTLISAALRELIILRVAVINGATFEFAAHTPHAHAAGVSDAKIQALYDYPATASIFSQDEVIVLTLTDHMTSDIEVPDAFMARLTQRFDPQETVEIVATVAAYNMVSRFLVALNIRH